MSVTTGTRPRGLLRVADLDALQLHQLLALAARMKGTRRAWLDALAGETLIALFEKPSTRTRVSFAAAAHQLGMLPQVLPSDELQLGRGETIEDTARVLSGFASVIAVRTFAQERLERFAAAATVPVINALSDDHHPCQALADLLTVRERFGGLAGVCLAYVGDGNNVVHSLLEAGALGGMQINVATPPGLEPDLHIVERAQRIAAENGGTIRLTDDPGGAVDGAQAVYTDVWVSMGEEAEARRRAQALRPFCVDEALMARAAPDAIFLHCLPAHRGQEVTAEVIDGPASAVWEQAENRLCTEQALIYALCTDDWEGAA